QYRVYEPGDDLSKVDWKLFARSDKYFVREAERESDINTWLLLDTSTSMLQQTHAATNKGEWNKLEYAKCLLSTIAYLAQKQGDSVGLLGLSNENNTYLPALSGERHWQRILLALARLKAHETFPNIDKVINQLGSIRKNGVIFFVSDFHQQNSEIIDLICQLASPRTEVVAIQLTCEDEETFPYKGAVRFEDLETKEEILVSAEQVKENYLTNKANVQSSLIADLSKNKVSHFLANIDQPLDQVLFDFLRIRNRALAK
ncbi:MAG: DUF58 domain-containing protein, partial [Colwellia sp.]|nr:DUF58 domain-containing protein [Colwellia sp.]